MSRNQACEIRDVWSTNLKDEFAFIRNKIEQYPYIAMDTEFPGEVAKPVGIFRSQAQMTYSKFILNVNLLKLIQLGIALLDQNGNLCPVCWQFNFHFDETKDAYAEASFDLLRRSGIDFARHSSMGIQPNDFAELLTTSGLVLSEDVTWITFAGSYDLLYLLKALTNDTVPVDSSEAMELLRLFFPNMFDVKTLMKSCKTLQKGLQDVADTLEVPRIGQCHTAGSDGILTGQCFFKMKEMFFEGIIDARFNGMTAGFEGLA
eukprot:m.86352 g.86352  ORF g.86352 m.86352 type:complete len:261 (-) comp12801_c0_seq3:1716-2498(-)